MMEHREWRMKNEEMVMRVVEMENRGRGGFFLQYDQLSFFVLIFFELLAMLKRVKIAPFFFQVLTFLAKLKRGRKNSAKSRFLAAAVFIFMLEHLQQCEAFSGSFSELLEMLL